MGKMKDLVIDQMNQEPKPHIVEENHKIWLVKSIKDDCIYRIYAESYERALDLLPMIENF